MVIVIYGVSGCGKSTVGKLLSEKLELPFYDADDYHPISNVEKMSKGLALNDYDREPWLIRLAELLSQSEGCVLACSALKEKYRITLSTSEKEIIWVHLKGSLKIISNRMATRKNHFMKVDMLQSQFDTLEHADYGQHIDISLSIEEIINSIIKNIESV